ncbi:bifunctional diguanylate cyclase/phosphodiesterase [Noviherbaspirillum massiliense]|uniref:bifunctional diguanylate cyclase/phosphodiesterase n=1 Tax=Noviherbaspirillum massiliense TaxID=1465823 RepID=UPI00035DD51B|nr:EAL domain-containing protein [Noviherbaspirillum massiliense]
MGLIDTLLSQAGARAGVDLSRRGLPELVKLLLVFCAYYLLTRFSVHFVTPPGVASAFWPPAALALCACLMWGMKMAPAVWLGATLANYLSSIPFYAASLIGIGNALEACVATFLMRRLLRTPLDFTRSEETAKFVSIAVLGSMLAASIGVTTLEHADRLGAAGMTLSWLTWWLGDAVVMIIITPLLLGRSTKVVADWTTLRSLEAIGFGLFLSVLTHVVFGGAMGRWPLAYVPIPLVIWAAFRFSLPGVTWTAGILCAIAVWHTSRGSGPFAIGDFNLTILLLLAYVVTVSKLGLFLASLLCQLGDAEETLKSERDQLEHRVQERTHELTRDIEERKRIERELAYRGRQLAEAQRLAQIGSWSHDLDSDDITWSDELYRIYGVQKGEFEPRLSSYWQLVHEDDRERVRETMEQARRTGLPFSTEHRIGLPSGGSKIVAARGFAEKDESGRIVRIFGSTQDITEAKMAEASLREAEERYRLVVELSPDAILVQQDQVFSFANPAAIALLGADNAGQIVGKAVFDFLHPDFHQQERERLAILGKGGKVSRTEEKLVRVDGSTVDVDINSSSFMHKGRPAVLRMMRDITERKRSAEQLAYLAHYDSLTGLPNRALFHQRLNHALTIAERPGRSLEVLFLDLDRFKEINDTLGHAVGDLVLKETAHRLQSILRESDTVARLGGDEFVVLVENVDEPLRGGVIAEKILAAIALPFMRDTKPLVTSTSIGISCFPDDGKDATTLLKKADIAMYRAKQMGRNGYQYFSSEMNLHTTERLNLEHALRHAVARQQLSLHYQPKFDVRTRKITGMEALLRWQHPAKGFVPPEQFIPLAEETGLINAIGDWTIREACLQNRQWQQASAMRLKVAVNLSARQLASDRLVETVRAILDETGLDPAYLELEITERAVMTNPEKAVATLTALHDIGVSVAMDDFGIGYSSLAYLKRFPIRAMKIDRSFVQGIPGNRGDEAVARAIIDLAHDLDCSVIAEGAETQEQVDFLYRHRCDSVQGYYFSGPVNADRFGQLLQQSDQLH